MTNRKLLNIWKLVIICCFTISCKSELMINFEKQIGPNPKNKASTAEIVSVDALYPNFGQGWFDHLRNTSSNYYEANDDEACNLADTKIHDCLHGGQIRKFEVRSASECIGLSAKDSLGVFDWYCIEKTDHVLFVSRLQSRKGLSDLITETSWLENSVSVKDNGTEIAYSNPSAWWNDSISPAISNATSIVNLSTSGIYTFSSDESIGGYRVNADDIALVGIGETPPTLTYNADGNYCTSTGGAGTSTSCFLVIPFKQRKYLD
jgi:hypothetical protein